MKTLIGLGVANEEIHIKLLNSLMKFKLSQVGTKVCVNKVQGGGGRGTLWWYFCGDTLSGTWTPYREKCACSPVSINSKHGHQY